MRTGSQPRSDSWIATATKHLARYPQLQRRFRAFGKRCRTGAGARGQKLRVRPRLRQPLRQSEATERFALEVLLQLPRCISFHVAYLGGPIFTPMLRVYRGPEQV